MKTRLIALSLASAVLIETASAQATRGPELERLSMLVGTFEGEVRYSPPGMNPQVGRMTYHGAWDLDGWLVRSRYDQVIGNRPAVGGLLIFRWRPKDSTYAFEGYANTPMEPHRLTGRWEDGLVFEGTAGSAMYRERWQLRGADTLVNAMEFRRNGEWIKVSEAILVRKRSP
jgi:hypothetical protein